ncbi:Rieske (2Fe-2S) protein [Streptomyces sp. DH24]|uniref:Rieske (2Fe-2S) protein n=1 Tax=Streptomyces sp. DH24 TaxID=3040123 RepID=UPI002440EDF3|nr:Rieske (2Fe-2S) protein [Streptomyces sp. DH24]MDG9718150.1 Rieske (2Fe-2S) protein [Streptomyces sp. DH24]
MAENATRRTVLLAAGAAALTAGCGGGDGEGRGDAGRSVEATGGQELAATSDIPVGGGRIFKAEKVVVTQPEEGEFKAFSAICTHQSCTVASVSDGTINCACHGSRFRVADGAVEKGPATRALPAERITVEGNSIRLA